MPPLFDSLWDSRPCAQAATPLSVSQWLAANKSQKPITSSEAVQSAQLSLTRLEGAIAQGKCDGKGLDISFSSLVTEAAAQAPPVVQPESDAKNGIYQYLVTSIAAAKEAGDTSKMEALNFMLNKDFPAGEPKQQPPPPPPQLSPGHELNLLSAKSSQTLREMLTARSTLETAKDRVVAAQSLLDEAKEKVTQSAAEMNLALRRYTEADNAVRDFNSKVAALESQRSAQIVYQVAQMAPGTPKDGEKEKQRQPMPRSSPRVWASRCSKTQCCQR